MAIRVLIADPDPDLLTSYRTRLSQDGFEVSRFDCLEGLHTFEPNVMVLEPEMPWGGGVLAVMHHMFERPLVPVFVITSRQTATRLNLRQFPLVTHVQTKPVRADELVRLIRHIADEPRPVSRRSSESNPPYWHEPHCVRCQEWPSDPSEGDTFIGVRS
jgi:DNA-binding NtrC family response regulator